MLKFNSVAIKSLIVLSLVGLCVQAKTFAGPEARIVGGDVITIEKAPYQVSLRLKAIEMTFGNGHICGGSVISQRVVVTSILCLINGSTNKFRQSKEFTVVMGTAELNNNGTNTLRYDVQKTIRHDKFSKEYHSNDIALLFLNGTIPWNWPTVKSVGLQTKEMKNGVYCFVSGFGYFDTTNKFSNNLRQERLPIEATSRCSSAYNHNLEGMLCAGYLVGGSDFCTGDLGGPLVCNNLLTGIASWGLGCGLPNYPGVYTNVTDFNDWIIAQNRSLDYSDFLSGDPEDNDNDDEDDGAMSQFIVSKAFLFSSTLFVLFVSYFRRM